MNFCTHTLDKRRNGGMGWCMTHHFLEFINSMTLQGQINKADDLIIIVTAAKYIFFKNRKYAWTYVHYGPNTVNSIAPHVMQVQRLGPLCYVINFE